MEIVALVSPLYHEAGLSTCADLITEVIDGSTRSRSLGHTALCVCLQYPCSISGANDTHADVPWRSHQVRPHLQDPADVLLLVCSST